MVDVLKGGKQFLGAAEKQTATVGALYCLSDFQIAGVRFEKLLTAGAFESNVLRKIALVLMHQQHPGRWILKRWAVSDVCSNGDMNRIEQILEGIFT
ncbi:MAG: hypothetical protein KAU27_13685 [Desulfuromonadales bacterium]|nr:hypothetical protein [Desulfuromonadales bacterium]